mmetsp:Transcript_22537/g.29492  ORF Transcript_22537/g.29492 Transcript_22537/m.29492 type:complete len:146 (-) Transcript_22537:13-450(-)
MAAAEDWPGEAELVEALTDLASHRPISASRVRIAANLAMDNIREYKMVVYTIEKFVRKSPPEFRLPVVVRLKIQPGKGFSNFNKHWKPHTIILWHQSLLVAEINHLQLQWWHRKYHSSLFMSKTILKATNYCIQFCKYYVICKKS